MTNINDALSRAIDHLGAVEVEPGYYAVKMPGGRYRVGDAQRIIRASECTSGSGIPWDAMALMRPWWSPEQRFACAARCSYLFHRAKRDATGDESETLGLSAPPDEPHRYGCRIVTASLETGEKVPA